MKNIAKILCFVLSLVFVFSVIGVCAFAEDVTIVLPEGVTAESFGDKTVTDGTNYYATLVDALLGIHLTGNDTLWCKPGADVGKMTHGHVCDNLTVFGNGAYISGGECDFEVDTYKYCHNAANSCDGITDDLTLNVYALNKVAVWGQRNTENTISVNLVECDNVNRICITGAKGVNNVYADGCTFDAANGSSSCTVLLHAAGNSTFQNCSFDGIAQPICINNKSAESQDVKIYGCSFTDCGSDAAAYNSPVRVVCTGNGSLELAVEDSTFSGTKENGAGQVTDILIDSDAAGKGMINSYVSGTDAVLTVETEPNVGKVTYIESYDSVDSTNAVAEVDGVKYETLAEALATGADYVVVHNDTTEALGSLTNVTLMAGNADVTITNTTAGVIDFDNVTVGYGVTLNVGNIYSGDSNNNIMGNLNVSGTYEHSWNAFTEVNGNVNANNLVISNNDADGAFVVLGALDCGTLSIDSGELRVVWGTVECDNLVATGSAGFSSMMCTIIAANYSFDPELDYKAVDNGDGTISIVEKQYVAEVDGVKFEDFTLALKALDNGSVLQLLNDITISDTWVRSGTGSYIKKEFTFNGNDYTIKFTGAINDPNYMAAFRFEGANTVINDLTIDLSEATGCWSAISAKYGIELYNCNFVGNASSRRAVIFGEGAGAAISDVEVVVDGCTFSDCGIGLADNMNGQDAKSVTVTDSEFNNAKVQISAYESIVFTGNTVSGATLSITSYTAKDSLVVNVVENELDPGKYHSVKAGSGTIQSEVNAQAPGLPSIGSNGNWFIGNLDTGVIAVPNITIVDGYWYVNGVSTGIRAESINGHTPTVEVGEDGYWYIDGEKTDFLAKATDGVGIKEIVKQSSDGNVDTYVITFTDENMPPVIFTVTNGLDGNQGPAGIPGEEGPMGLPGEQGAPGVNGYDGNEVVIIAVIVAAACTVITIIVLGVRVFKRDPFLLNL